MYSESVKKLNAIILL